MSGIVIISTDVETPLKSIINIHEEENQQQIEAHDDDATLSRSLESIVCNALNIPIESFGDIVGKTLLVRSTTTANDAGEEEVVPGMHAYHFNHPPNPPDSIQMMKIKPNIRATRLAMAMGLFRVRFYGTVVLVREESSSKRRRQTAVASASLIDHVAWACNVSPDLRSSIFWKELRGCSNNNDNNNNNDDDAALCVQPTAVVVVPDWIANAAMNSYHDEDALSQLAVVMKRNLVVQEKDNDDDEVEVQDSDNNRHDMEKPVVVIGTTNDNNDIASSKSDDAALDDEPRPALPREFVAKSPLCFHCRGPTESLCQECHAVYFCDLPRNCRSSCWSHDSQCQTWRLYEKRRTLLSSLPLGAWHQELMGRDFQLSPLPYEQFLVEKLKVINKEHSETTREEDIVNNRNSSSYSWWMTELDHGWYGGQSDGAKTIEVEMRCSFQQGFHPIVDIPPDRPVSQQEVEQCSSSSSYCITRNQVGWLCLHSWRDYYKLRGIPESSPVALLLTFPLTLYYGIAEYGQVPCTVARMLKRPLRIHVVGVEKELKLLDLFKEVAYLMPSDFSLELVFIVRDDMLPESLKKDMQTDNSKRIVVKLCNNLGVYIASGTYGDSIDPNFDCGSGAPDIVMAFNAGFYAYKSWRSVIRFLDVHRGVVGIFTDYNEYSGLGCASLGGAKSRESLCMNPFRQPRAMPVYSMNLPQFSNGFLYVYNQQELE